MGFTIIRRGCHLGYVTQMWRTNFRSPYPVRLHVKSGFVIPMVSEKMFEAFSLYESIKNK